jgi:hypothetical protein
MRITLKEGLAMTKVMKQNVLTYAALAYGILLSLVLVDQFIFAFLLDATDDWWRFFYLFTYQTNIMVAVWSICYGLGKLLNRPSLLKIIENKVLVIIITVNTLIVFFIVFFVLNPVFEGEWQPFESLSELLTHNLSTVFMMIYFIAVPGVGVLKKTDAITVLIYPFIYFFIHTFVGLNFNFKDGNPAFNYGFINPTNYSENFIVFIILFVSLVAIFGALGFVLIQLKNKITAK